MIGKSIQISSRIDFQISLASTLESIGTLTVCDWLYVTTEIYCFCKLWDGFLLLNVICTCLYLKSRGYYSLDYRLQLQSKPRDLILFPKHCLPRDGLIISCSLRCLRSTSHSVDSVEVILIPIVIPKHASLCILLRAVVLICSSIFVHHIRNAKWPWRAFNT